MEITLGSRGRIVIPKEMRKNLNLKRGTKLKIRVENSIVIFYLPSKPPDEIFIHAGDQLVDQTLKEAKKIDAQKIKRLRKNLGASE